MYPLLRAKAVRALRDVWRIETHLTAHDGDDVVVELPGHFEIVAAAMLTLLGMNVVFNELGIGRRLGPKDPRMLAMLLPSQIVGCTLARFALVLGTFTAL